MEPAAGIEPANLILTKDVLYQLSYTGKKLDRLGVEPSKSCLQSRIASPTVATHMSKNWQGWTDSNRHRRFWRAIA